MYATLKLPSSDPVREEGDASSLILPPIAEYVTIASDTTVAVEDFTTNDPMLPVVPDKVAVSGWPPVYLQPK